MIAISPPRTTPPTFTPAPPSHAILHGNGQFRAPTHGEIARCAYDIYIAHGRTEGRSQQDWLQAEEELAQTPRASWPKVVAHSHA